MRNSASTVLSGETIKKLLIYHYYSIQWCRFNVVPVVCTDWALRATVGALASPPIRSLWMELMMWVQWWLELIDCRWWCGVLMVWVCLVCLTDCNSCCLGEREFITSCSLIYLAKTQGIKSDRNDRGVKPIARVDQVIVLVPETLQCHSIVLGLRYQTTRKS